MGHESIEETPDKSQELYDRMKGSLSDLMVSKAGSEEELRAAFEDSLTINRVFDSMTTDTDGIYSVEAFQEVVDELVTKHGLNAENFSVSQYCDALKEFDKSAGQ